MLFRFIKGFKNIYKNILKKQKTNYFPKIQEANFKYIESILAASSVQPTDFY